MGVVGLAFLMTFGQKPESIAASFTVQDRDRPKAEIGQAF